VMSSVFLEKYNARANAEILDYGVVSDFPGVRDPK